MHNQLLPELLNYLTSGGYPESALTWKLTKNSNKLDEIQNKLFNEIKHDFIMSSSNINTKKLFEIWENIPVQLIENKSKKIMFSKINKTARAREFDECIQWLSRSFSTFKLNQLKEDKLPLKEHVNKSNFRLLINDTELLKKMLKISNENILLNKEYQHKTQLLECFVYQQLTELINSENIYYYSFNKFELDFIIEYKNLIIPIDVKASNIKSNNALRSYMRKHDSIGIRYTFGYLKYEDNIIHIPFYLINKTTEFIDYWIEKYKGQN